MPEQITYKKNKISFEMANELSKSKILFLNNWVPKEMKVDGQDFIFISFKDDDYEKKLYTIESWSVFPHYVYTTLPGFQGELQKTIDLLMEFHKLNRPNKFELIKVGHNADDFIQGRLTFKLKPLYDT